MLLNREQIEAIALPIGTLQKILRSLKGFGRAISPLWRSAISVPFNGVNGLKNLLVPEISSERVVLRSKRFNGVSKKKYSICTNAQQVSGEGCFWGPPSLGELETIEIQLEIDDQ